MIARKMRGLHFQIKVSYFLENIIFTVSVRDLGRSGKIILEKTILAVWFSLFPSNISINRFVFASRSGLAAQPAPHARRQTF